MNEQRILFEFRGLKLYGILHLPENSPIALIVGVHGLMADKNSPKQIALAKRIVTAKMAYFRFDHRGCGESDGLFNEQTTLENRRCDLIAAVQTAQAIVGDAIPTGLFGSSLGGTVCLYTSNQVTPFAIATLAAPVWSRPFQLPKDSPDSLKDEIVGKKITFNIKESIKNIHHILIIHGSADEIVPKENADTIYRLSGHPKKQLILENGDHRVSDPLLQKHFVEATANWFVTCYQEQFRK